MSSRVRLLAPLLRVPKRPFTPSPHPNAFSESRFRPTLIRRSTAAFQTSSYSSNLPKEFTRFSDDKRKKRFRNIRYVLYVAIFGGLGYWITDALFMTDRIVYEPGSLEDTEELEELGAEFENLDIVKQLRMDEEYVEWETYGNLTPEQKAKRFTSGSLKGSRGISVQRVFFNESKKTATTILHLGPGIEGWPGVIHGGALSTILDENLGRVAILSLPARTGVTANLNINFRRPARACQFFAVTATCDPNLSSERKAIVKGEIRNESGELCAEALGTFVVPKKLQLKTIGEGF